MTITVTAEWIPDVYPATENKLRQPMTLDNLSFKLKNGTATKEMRVETKANVTAEIDLTKTGESRTLYQKARSLLTTSPSDAWAKIFGEPSDPMAVALAAEFLNGKLENYDLSQDANAVLEANTVTATYTQYTITANAGTGGSISPAGATPVYKGNDQSFTITPNSGYRIADVKVDGNSVGAVNTYTFTNVTADHTIVVTFEKKSSPPIIITPPDDDDEPDQPADPDDTGVSDLLNTEDHIQYLFGYPDGTFGPENNMTRAEVAQMFYNLLLDQDVEITKTFDDVPANAWYTKAVNTLASLDIISGVGDNKFEPERSITRAEFTAMAMKFAVGGEEGENIFSDVDEDDWFYDAVVNSIQYGWIHGYGDGTFRPNNPITRAEVTAIVNNMLGRAADEDFVDEHTEELTPFSDIEKHWAYYHIVEATNDHDYTKPSSGENWTKLN